MPMNDKQDMVRETKALQLWNQHVKRNSCTQFLQKRKSNFSGWPVTFNCCWSRNYPAVFYVSHWKVLLDIRHGVIVIDYNRLQFLSNRNRLNWPKMTCSGNRNRLHCKFNRNRRFISRLNLEIFILHHCAMNRSFGGWVPPFIIICYGYASGEAICRLCALNPDNPAASTAFVANSRFAPASLPVGHQK